MRQRIDDFRCFDPTLVEILKGREIEAVNFAKSLNLVEAEVGLFVLGEDVRDWNFIDHIDGLTKLELVKVNRSFCLKKLPMLRHLKRFRLVDLKCDSNFSKMPALEYLQFEWTDFCEGLDLLNSLRSLHISGIKKSRKVLPLRIPKCVTTLSLIQYGHEELQLLPVGYAFEMLQIVSAPALRYMPAGISADELELHGVRATNFDYESLPIGLKSLSIENGSPISNWNFLDRLPELDSLFINRTSCSAMPVRFKEKLTSFGFVVLPRSVGFYET